MEADLKDIRDVISQVKLLITLSIGGGGLSLNQMQPYGHVFRIHISSCAAEKQPALRIGSVKQGNRKDQGYDDAALELACFVLNLGIIFHYYGLFGHMSGRKIMVYLTGLKSLFSMIM